MSNSNSGTLPASPAFEKKNGKVFGKNTVTLLHNIAYKVNNFVSLHMTIMTIAYKNYSMICT